MHSCPALVVRSDARHRFAPIMSACHKTVLFPSFQGQRADRAIRRQGLTGSPALRKTIGMVAVAALAASVARSLVVTITATADQIGR